MLMQYVPALLLLVVLCENYCRYYAFPGIFLSKDTGMLLRLLNVVKRLKGVNDRQWKTLNAGVVSFSVLEKNPDCQAKNKI